MTPGQPVVTPDALPRLPAMSAAPVVEDDDSIDELLSEGSAYAGFGLAGVRTATARP